MHIPHNTVWLYQNIYKYVPLNKSDSVNKFQSQHGRQALHFVIDKKRNISDSRSNFYAYIHTQVQLLNKYTNGKHPSTLTHHILINPGSGRGIARTTEKVVSAYLFTCPSEQSTGVDYASIQITFDTTTAPSIYSARANTLEAAQRLEQTFRMISRRGHTHSWTSKQALTLFP